MIKIAEAINSFAREAEQADVSSEESVFALTGSQIQEIITRVIQPLQGEVSQLKATVANLEGKVSDLEATQDAQGENELNMLRLVNELKHKPEVHPSALIDELYKEIVAQGRKQVDFGMAARMVKRSKGRLIQLKAAIALDQRFILVPSERHSQKLLIRLREFYKTE